MIDRLDLSEEWISRGNGVRPGGAGALDRRYFLPCRDAAVENFDRCRGARRSVRKITEPLGGGVSQRGVRGKPTSADVHEYTDDPSGKGSLRQEGDQMVGNLAGFAT
jgi:hypothetical protein